MARASQRIAIPLTPRGFRTLGSAPISRIVKRWSAVSDAAPPWLRASLDKAWRGLMRGPLLGYVLDGLSNVSYVAAGIVAFLVPASATNAIGWTVLALFLAGVGLAILALVRKLLVARNEKNTELRGQASATELAQLRGELVVAAEALAGLSDEVMKYVTAMLERLLENAGLDHRERVSLYLLIDDELALVARYCRDATLATINAENRDQRLPYSHGLVGRSARLAIRLNPQVGPPSTVASEVRYREWQRQNGWTYPVGGGPSMQSRLYDVVPSFASSDSHDVLGVVCLESVRSRCDALARLGDLIERGASLEAAMVRESLTLLTSAIRGRAGEERHA